MSRNEKLHAQFISFVLVHIFVNFSSISCLIHNNKVLKKFVTTKKGVGCRGLKPSVWPYTFLTTLYDQYLYKTIGL